MTRLLLAAALAAALPAGIACAADMTFTPASNSNVIIYSAPNMPAVRVQPTGEVQLPGLPGTPASGTSGVCHDANGTLQRCDPAALAGPAGPQGAQGSQGPTGPMGPQGPEGPPGVQGVQGAAGSQGATGADGAAGANGANGHSALIAISLEAPGAHCADGGQKLEVGVDANGNGSLEPDEIEPAQTSYLCNGAKGDTGATGAKGDTGATGQAGAVGANGTNGANGQPGADGQSAVLTMAAEPAGANCANGGQRINYGVGSSVQTSYVCNGANGANGSNGGLSGVVHGCFSDDPASGIGNATGTGYSQISKNPAGPTYTISFSTAFANAAYTVLLDGRTATGRALALSVPATTGKTAAQLQLARGWLEADSEAAQPLSICFMLAQ